MLKLLSLVVLALQLGTLAPDTQASTPQKSRQEISYPAYGCACHCDTSTASLRIWQQKDGPADRFAVRAIGRWFYAREKFTRHPPPSPPSGPGQFAREELLVLLGLNTEGVWALELLVTDAGGETYIDLVCTTNEGKRKTLPVAAGLLPSQMFSSAKLFPAPLVSRVSRRLRQLAKTGRWHPDSLVPVELPLLSRAPALVFRPKRHPNGNWSWTLSARSKDGRLVPIQREGPAPVLEFFQGARLFGGIKDVANGETWWVLTKTLQSDNCGAEWRSIRLTQP